MSRLASQESISHPVSLRAFDKLADTLLQVYGRSHYLLYFIREGQGSACPSSELITDLRNFYE